MDKKKIKVSYLLLPLSMLLSITVQSQEFWTEELQWQNTNELYQSMVNFVNEEPYEKFKLPKVVDVGLDNYFWALFTKKKREKNFAELKRIEQQKVKNFIEAYFVFNDTIPELIFCSKEQIIDWSKEQLPFSLAYSAEFFIQNCNIYIVLVAGCSGVTCWKIYVFKEKGGLWKLITGTSAILKEVITVEADNDEEKIVFAMTSGKVIGVLPFNVLNDD